MRSVTVASKCKISERNASYLQDKYINEILEDLKRFLKIEALKIKRPYYLDNDDLIQEALFHVYKNRDAYDESLSSIKTWSLEISRRKFYNVAKDGFRKKRFPQDVNGRILFPAELTESTGGCCYNKAPDYIHEIELIAETIKRLHGLPLKVFNILIDPEEKLIQLVMNEDHKQKSRVRHVNKDENKIEKNKEPQTFHISNDKLAKYLGVKTSNIIKAKDKIRAALRKASCVCDGI